ncbi:CRISPR-associated protein (cas_TM1802) [uncultured archaeon]|nr:CRISPR-associated protein (cas_TM1802) [uncultured archaeon]
MLSAIREIGKWQIAKSSKNELDVLIKEPNFKNGGKVALIKINLDEKRFEGVELEDYDSTKVHKYLFRGGVSQGPNPTPISIINIKKPQTTYDGKIQKWFVKYSNSGDILKEDRDFIENIKCILSDNHDQIIQAIENCIADVPKKEGKLLTVKIKQGIDWKYIGEFEIFKKLLKEKESKKIGGVITNCSICGIQKELSEDAGVFKFYTIDKPGFITGGFEESLAWKNFPTCSECKLELEEGRKFIEANLNYKFYGLNYLLIPKLLLREIREIDAEIFEILLDNNKLISLKERVKKRITDNEKDILEALAEEKDTLTFNFLFLKPEQSAERILLLIEDVFPSRIKRIFEAKDAVDKNTGDSYTLGKIRHFFAKSDENKREYDLNTYFLEIIDSIFRGVSIEFSFLNSFFMAKIRRDFLDYDSKGNEKFNFQSSIKNALMSIMFFENLGLITFAEMIDLKESNFEELFKKYGNTFNLPVKRGLFLAGALTEMLLRKQGKERGTKPFMKKLKGLKMDERDIKALLPAIQNKFEEYNSFGKGKRIVAEEAYDYLFASGENWKLSVDEINFFFAGGMNLASDIDNILYAEGEKDIDEGDNQSTEKIKK